MKLKLERRFKGKEYTIGKLFINGNYFCDTLEDAVRDKKIYAETAIPSGKYELTVTYSNRFKKRLPLILNVPGYEGVRIHTGNYADFKEFLKDIEIPKDKEIFNCTETINIIEG